jgi:glycosyltransferase involved in cell wall biosynthesis
VSDPVALSVVIPAYNEAKSVRPLVDECVAALERLGRAPWEIVLVDDGSTDGTDEIMRGLVREKAPVKAVLRFMAALDGGLDLVSGWKKERHDPFQRRVLSRIFNFVLRKTSGLALHDANCGFKAYRRWCVEGLEIRGNQHRFIPAILERHGAQVGEIEVRHRARPFGASKYGPARYAQGMVDLATMLLLTRFAQKPLYFFALVGLPLLVLGVLIDAWLIASHLLHLVLPDMGTQLTIRPLLVIGAVLFLAGLQIFLIGLVAELVLQASRIEKSYDIREVIAGMHSAARPGAREAAQALEPAMQSGGAATPAD